MIWKLPDNLVDTARRAMTAAADMPAEVEVEAPAPAPDYGRPIPPAERDPNAWAIYLRAGDVGDGAAMMRTLRKLLKVVEHADGHVTGIYGDVGPAAGPEMAVLLGHATFNRFTNLAVADAGALGSELDAVAHIALALYDLGVNLYAYRHAGDRSLAGIPLSLEQVGREILGATDGRGYGRTIDVITNAVGTAPGRERGAGTG